MKKIISLAAAAIMLLAGTEAYAQFYFGGSAGFASTTVKVSEDVSLNGSTTFKILPEVGYQINDKMAVGAQIGYLNGPGALGGFDPSDLKGIAFAASDAAVSAVGNTEIMGVKLSAFRVAPYFRYTFYSNHLLEVFADAAIAYTVGNGKQYDKSEEVWDNRGTISVIEAGIKPGFKVKVSKNFHLVGRLGSFGYQSLKVKDVPYSVSRFGLDVDGSNILFGFVYVL